MTRRLFAFALVFVILFALVAPAFAQQNPVASVNTGYLNLRSGPGLQYGSVAALPKGFGVQLVARNNEANWVYVSLTNGVTGWLNVNYLYTTYPIRSLPVGEHLVAAPLIPSGSVTGALLLNMHTTPDEASAIVRSIEINQPFELLGRSFDSRWAQIRLPDGTTGWVLAEYLSTTAPVRSVSPADGSVYAPPPPTSGGGQTGSTRTHLVVAGDTLARIAQRYGVSMYAIAAANNIVNLNRIYRGQRLIIP